MNPTQPILEKAKKTLQFIWRHILTLYIITVILRAIFAGHASVINSCIFLSGAIFIDWAKQFMKPNRSFDPHSRRNPHTDIGTPIHIRQWSNPGIMGTGAYDLNRGGTKWDK